MTCKMQTTLAGRTALLVMAVLLGNGTAQAQITNVFDDFNRANSASLGTTSVGGFLWNENEPGSGGQILLDTGTARFGSRGDGTDPTANLALTLFDLDMSVTINGLGPANDNFFAGLSYRLASTNSLFADGTAGYRVRLDTSGFNPPSSPDDTISLLWGNTILAQYTSPVALSNGVDYRLRVIASGPGHTVFLDGVQVLSFLDSDLSRTNAGYVGIGTYYGNYTFDDFVVTVPEPSAAMLIGLGFAAACLSRRQRST